MKIFPLIIALFLSFSVASQVSIDTLGIQDFESVPATPTWGYTGTPNNLMSGFTTASASPANSPIGINGSTAWHVESVSGGNPLTFDNISIPFGYDSLKLQFKVAAMNHTGTTGGPDNLDYILVELSTDGGLSYYARLRVRGSVDNNCTWAYNATGIAQLDHVPQTEVVFEPSGTGELTNGYATVVIDFPGTVSDISAVITPRSSSTTDDWMIDNVMLLGYTYCPPSTNSVSATICFGDSYFAGNAFQTQSGTYYDTLTNVNGCDSIVTTSLTVTTLDTTVTQTGFTLSSNGSGLNYQWLDCDSGYIAITGAVNQTFSASSNGNFAVAINDGTCSDTSLCISIVGMGIEQESEVGISIYPVPARNQLTVTLDKHESEFRASLFNTNGLLIKRVYSQSAEICLFDLDGISSGMYLLKIDSDKGTTTHRVLVVN